MNAHRLSAAVLAIAALSACATKSGTGTAVGAGGGAIVGGALGGTTGALIGGALGGVLGYGVGSEMDRQDAMRTQAAFEAGQRSAWESNGNRWDVNPTQTMIISGRECREFTMQRIEPNGRRHHADGIACRQPNGEWQIQS